MSRRALSHGGFLFHAERLKFFESPRVRVRLDHVASAIEKAITASHERQKNFALPPCLELSRRIETEQYDDQNEEDRSYNHGFVRVTGKQSPLRGRRGQHR